jgi:hypothetical protein
LRTGQRASDVRDDNAAVPTGGRISAGLGIQTATPDVETELDETELDALVEELTKFAATPAFARWQLGLL